MRGCGGGGLGSLPSSVPATAPHWSLTRLAVRDPRRFPPVVFRVVTTSVAEFLHGSYLMAPVAIIAHNLHLAFYPGALSRILCRGLNSSKAGMGRKTLIWEEKGLCVPAKSLVLWGMWRLRSGETRTVQWWSQPCSVSQHRVLSIGLSTLHR